MSGWRRLMPAMLALGAVLSIGAAQADQPAAAGASNLQVYELPDKSASILLPSDWHVVQTGVAYARARGPNGELALFGAIIPANNSSAAATKTVLNQSYSADNKDKFTQSVNFILVHIGMSAVPVQIKAETHVDAPDGFGTCSNIKALLGPRAGVAAEADFCSLPMNKDGSYQNFFKLVAVQASRAAEEKPMLEKILASYALESKVVKARSKALTQTGAAGAGPAGMAGVANSAMSMALINAETRMIQQQTLRGQIASYNSASDFDHSILRGDTGVYAEGSSEPLFWISND